MSRLESIAEELEPLSHDATVSDGRLLRVQFQPIVLDPLLDRRQCRLCLVSTAAQDDKSSHPREPPPRVLTEPDVNVSAHPALPIEACPHSNVQCANSRVCLRAIRANQ